MANPEINAILRFAISLAEMAGQTAMNAYRRAVVSIKPDGSEVTDADRAAEENMRAAILKEFPTHQILGEEFGGPSDHPAGPLWVLDPIDGTTSFVLGVPIFGSLVAYLENGEPQAGVMHFPAMQETVFAARGQGCWFAIQNEPPQRVRVSGTASIGDAIVSACSAGPSDIRPHPLQPALRLSAVIARSRRFRFVTDCLQHALVARGRLDGAIDLVMHPWDIAAIVPCIEEAGGVVCDLSGNRSDIVWQSSLLSASSVSLQQRIIALLHGVRP